MINGCSNEVNTIKRCAILSGLLVILFIAIAMNSGPILYVSFTLASILFLVYCFLCISLLLNAKQRTIAIEFLTNHGYMSLSIPKLVLRVSLISVSLFCSMLSGLIAFYLLFYAEDINTMYAISSVVFFTGASLTAKALFIGLDQTPKWKNHLQNCLIGAIVFAGIPSILY